MNLRRHLEEARAETPEPEPVSEPVPDVKEAETVIPDVQIVEAEPLIPDVQIDEEPVIEVTPEIVEGETETAVEETAADEVNIAVEAEAGTDGEITDDDLPEKPELNMSMKKEELLEAARERGVKVSPRATKAAIIEAIEKAEEADNQ